MVSSDGRSRVVIENVHPEIDAGQFAVKRTVGESVDVEADIFTDGHDAITAILEYRLSGETDWREVFMAPLVNDRWEASFSVELVGVYEYSVRAWIDRFVTWKRDLRKRVAANQAAAVDMLIGAELIDAALPQASGRDAQLLLQWTRRLRHQDAVVHAQQVCEDAELSVLMRRYSNREFAVRHARTLKVLVDRERAGYSAWYEMFPRSAADEPNQHGTLKDVETRLPYVAKMGFDVLYLPPIHPIGRTFRKGKNNATEAQPDDVGSPWGIGAEEGGHKDIHPQLGTFQDFYSLLKATAEHGMELAMDIAFQCAPDHPYVREHPDWFRQRPDGTIQYAENPPKKYQDIYPFDFETKDWRALWQELKSIFEFWIEKGVRIFRVDNPHTKPFSFWEWCIGEIKSEHPDVLFLAEAFTRPKIMHRLAKLGFTQSYTYFAWRNTKQELTEYVTELTESEVREFFRPNFWPNTPDILPEYLQLGGRPAFMARFVLAALLSPNYGIYGPPFEHCWGVPREHGSEEYLASEKYQIHRHDLKRLDSLSEFIARVNEIRREFPVFLSNDPPRFHDVDNNEILCFSKMSSDKTQLIVVVVNLDPHHLQGGWVRLPLEELGLEEAQPYQVHDLLSEGRYLWHGERNFVELDPQICPAHVFQIRRRVRSERDFEYYL